MMKVQGTYSITKRDRMRGGISNFPKNVFSSFDEQKLILLLR